MIETLLPSGVVGVETAEPPALDALHPEERAALGDAADGRVREFAAGRSCARRALVALGHPEVPIGRGSDRQPLWPNGVVGSITHCRGYCAAVAAHRVEYAGLGVDAEPHEPLPDGVAERIARPPELAWAAGRTDGVCWDRLLFSAKEAVFKAWYPLTERWLGFEDASIRFDADKQTFRADLLAGAAEVDGSQVHAFTGRFAVRDGLVLTLVAAAAHGSRDRA
jgi:4'-phosphopantetheinyl transferase EntD